MKTKLFDRGADRPAALSFRESRFSLAGILVAVLVLHALNLQGYENDYFKVAPDSSPRVPTDRVAPTRPSPSRPFEVGPSDVRRSPSPGTAKPVDKGKIKSLFDKAKEPPAAKKQSSGGVSTQSATGTSKESKARPRAERQPTPESKPPAATDSSLGSVTAAEVTQDAPPSRERETYSTGDSALPTIKAEDMLVGPQPNVLPFELEVYLQTPDRPRVELPKGGAELPGTGLPGKDGIGGLTGGFQGGLERPTLDHNTGEEHYQGEMPGGYNPAIDPSGAMGDAGGYLGAAGRAYGGGTGKTMEQVGGIMQSGSLGEAAGKGADILIPGSGSFVEAAAKGDTAGMVNAGATAAGNLASDLAMGLILGLVGGGLLGMAVGYALSATGAGRAIADGVTAGVKWVAEKLGVGGSEPPPPEPQPEPEPAPEPAMPDENYTKNHGKKGPSVINENHIRPLQEKLNEDLLGENRDAEEFVDTSDAPPPSKVAVAAGCDLDDLANKGSGTINFKDPFTVKDMEKPGYDKY